MVNEFSNLSALPFLNQIFVECKRPSFIWVLNLYCFKKPWSAWQKSAICFVLFYIKCCQVKCTCMHIILFSQMRYIILVLSIDSSY